LLVKRTGAEAGAFGNNDCGFCQKTRISFELQIFHLIVIQSAFRINFPEGHPAFYMGGLNKPFVFAGLTVNKRLKKVWDFLE